MGEVALKPVEIFFLVLSQPMSPIPLSNMSTVFPLQIILSACLLVNSSTAGLQLPDVITSASGQMKSGATTMELRHRVGRGHSRQLSISKQALGLGGARSYPQPWL